MRLAILCALTASFAAGQPGRCRDNGAQHPTVELKGTIAQAQTGPGMAFIDVKSGKDSTRVQLGPMRYLIAEDFNPKAGEAVWVRGYGRQGFVMAAEVRLETQKRTLKFRDARGRPLWRGGPPCP
jgi:hypothetical protein